MVAVGTRIAPPLQIPARAANAPGDRRDLVVGSSIAAVALARRLTLAKAVKVRNPASIAVQRERSEKWNW
jgi:hypothetical protein